MKVCKECGRVPRVLKVSGNIEAKCVLLECAKCNRRTQAVKADFGGHDPHGQDAQAVITQEWDGMN